MNNNKANMVLLIAISVATLIVSVLGTSSLLFSLSAQDSTTSEVVDSSGSLLTCSGGKVSTNFGDSTIGGSNYNPGDIIATKTFTVTATSIDRENLGYEAFLYIDENTYSDSAITYTITSTTTNNIGSPIPKTTGKIKSGSNFKISLGKGNFDGPLSESDNPLHTYTVTISFANTGEDQSADANKTFKAEIKVA